MSSMKSERVTTMSSTTEGTPTTSDIERIRPVVVASVVGTIIEWYDFFIYGTAAALVFGQVFFPSSSPMAGTLAAFATYAVGFVIRPLGGFVFGRRDALADQFHLGAFDRTGVNELCLGPAVIVGSRYREADLIAGKRTFGNREIELVTKHFARQGLAILLETKGQILRLAAAALLVAYPYAVDFRSQNNRREEQAGKKTRDLAVHLWKSYHPAAVLTYKE